MAAEGEIETGAHTGFPTRHHIGSRLLQLSLVLVWRVRTPNSFKNQITDYCQYDQDGEGYRRTLDSRIARLEQINEHSHAENCYYDAYDKLGNGVH